MFNYRNHLPEDLYPNKRLEVQCMKCGTQQSVVYKNYKKAFDKIRLINDTECTNIYVCRKCSKSLQDTNKSILKKNSDAQKARSPESKKKNTQWMQDKLKKKIADEKGVITTKERYGETHYMNIFKSVDRAKALKTFKSNFLLKKKKEIKNIKILLNDIKEGQIESLDKSNILHMRAVRYFFNTKKYIHPVLFDLAIDTIKNNKVEYEIMKMTQVPRKSQGIIKRGWIRVKHKLIRFDSAAELTFILWNIESFLTDKIKRNVFGFVYEFDGKSRKYYPDFNDSKYYEIKYKTDYNRKKIKIDIKIKTCNAQLIFFEDMPNQYKKLARDLIKIYEVKQFNL